MKSSYRRYRQYQANRHQYKVEQITVPIAMMLIIGFLGKYWWIIIVGSAFLLVFGTKKQYATKTNERESAVNHTSTKFIEQNYMTNVKKEEQNTMSTTEIGYVNENNQRNNGRTDKPGTDNGHWFYKMECLECGYKYLANGSNIYEKKCPNCQNGTISDSDISSKKSTEIGYINKNNQKNNGKTNIPGTGNMQWFYDMECLECGHEYRANGHDIWLRKCPKCQGGRP